MASLKYEPLTGDEFRLLTLLPGAEEPVRCKLRNVRFGHLSFHSEGVYCWKKREVVVELNQSLSLRRLTSLPIDRLRRISGRPKSDLIMTLHVSNRGALGAGPRKQSIKITRGPKTLKGMHIGSGYYATAVAENGDSNEEIAWTRDELPFVPEYEALSYTWGAPAPTNTIIINGRSVDVRQNLHAALVKLRRDSEPRDLWIDALCIDQQNLEERNSQVARMSAIYQRASHLIVWLGSATDTSPRAFQLLEELGHHQPQKSDRWLSYQEWLGPQFHSWRGFHGGVAKHRWYEPEPTAKPRIRGLWKSKPVPECPKKIDSGGQRALQDLLTRPYWKRVWIIQELAHARKATLVCGDQSLDWSIVQAAISRPDCGRFEGSQRDDHWFCRFLDESGVAFLQNTCWRTRMPYRAHGFELVSSTLLRMLQDSWGFESTDPRDKIYALFGLPSIDDDMELPALDYGKPVSHIFSTVAKAIIRHERALYLLCLHHPTAESPLGLPSWVPDWSKRPDAIPLLFHVSPSQPEYAAASLTCVEGPGWEKFEDGRRTDLWANSPKLGDITQKDLLAVNLLGKRLLRHHVRSRMQYSKTAGDGQRAADDAWHFRGIEFLGDYDGLTTRKLGTLSISDPDDPLRLVVDGFVVGNVVSDNRAVTAETVATGAWKSIIREWEAFDDEYLLTADENSGRFPPLAQFLWTFTNGHFGRMSDETESKWLTVFYEKYLVWTGRLDVDSAPLRSMHDRVDDVEMALQRTVGWKFIISDKGHFGMAPARSRPGDLICVLFGADVPMILRKRTTPDDHTPSFEFIGPAYVHQIMFGEALGKFEDGSYGRSTFSIT